MYGMGLRSTEYSSWNEGCHSISSAYNAPANRDIAQVMYCGAGDRIRETTGNKLFVLHPGQEDGIRNAAGLA